MNRDLQGRVFKYMQNYKRPGSVEFSSTELRAFEILNKPTPKKKKKKLTFSQQKAYKVLSNPKKKMLFTKESMAKNKIERLRKNKAMLSNVLQIAFR